MTAPAATAITETFATDPNPLVASGEYVRVYAAEVEVGDILGTGDCVSGVHPAGGERVTIFTDAGAFLTYRRAATLLIKA